jgi:3'(2'), 5'-bisphosphate nucleotidase
MMEELLRIADGAAAIIRRHYASKIDVEYKIGDDPVTAADKEANAFICDALERAFPGVPIVAEESDPRTFDVRRDAAECFFVDPLDGTRDFVAKNGEFAVMIGLAKNGRAALGVVNAPDWGRTFAGEVGGRAFEIARDGSRRDIHTSNVERLADARCLVSRSRSTDETFALLAKLGVTKVNKLGSAGLKAAVVACGEADVWLQPGATGGGKLWDACGPEAITRAAGGVFSEIDYAAGPLELGAILVASTQKLYDSIAGLER